MEAGRILVGDHNGIYVLKFTGDVRVNLCATVDSFLQTLLNRDDFRAVIVDLTATEGIDSTSLGLLARLSLETRRRFGFIPTLVSTRRDITRLLDTMGFEDVFHIVEEPLSSTGQLGELPELETDEEDVRQRVLDAHKVLMGLNDRNRENFQDLVTALEAHSGSSR